MSEESNEKSKEAEFLKDLRAASIRTAVAHLSAIHRLKQSDSSAVPVGRGAQAGAGNAQTAAGLGEFLFDAARLHLNTYNQMLGLSSKYADQVIDSLRTTLRLDTPAPRPRRQLLEAAGPAGADTSRSFLIENRLTKGADVSLSVSEFRNIAGGPSFGAAVCFRAEPTAARQDPADRHVGPGEQRVFQMTVTLAPPFKAGQRYGGEAYVMMSGRIVEILEIRVYVNA